MNAHTPTESLLLPEEPGSDDRTFLNASLWYVDKDGYRVVFHRHEPIYRIALNDEVHLRLVALMLRQSRVATQEEICRAFGHSLSTQARWERQYAKHGIDGLTPKLQASSDQEASAPEESPATVSFTVDHDPRDRSGDRSLACAGLLDDAVPLFGNAECVPRAGVLLAVPLLVRPGWEYHGKFPLFRTKKAQRQVVTPAATDTWVHTADGELRVTIAARSSPHRTAALAALCEQLDALAVPFPGTHLRLRLAVQTPEPVIS